MRLSTRLVAPVLAGLFGLMAGAAAAFMVNAERRGNETPAVDPLGLGVEMDNSDCTGKKLLLIGWGETAAALDSGIASNPGSRYLKTADSCDTVYGRENGPTPEYAAYLGPYDSFSEPCELRMSVEHRGDQVTVLKAGNVQVVRCLCHLDVKTLPVLSPGMEPDAKTTQYVRALQQVLVDIDDEPFPQSRVTGFYDEPTEARVRELQDHIGATGIVDAETWGTILSDCDSYTY